MYLDKENEALTLKECYEILGGNYEDAVGRFGGERLVKKFALKFLNDGSFELLCRSLSEGDGEEAFRAAHTLKGVCQNLSFDRLSASSVALTEALRDRRCDPHGLLDAVKDDYEATAEAIRRFAEEDS